MNEEELDDISDEELAELGSAAYDELSDIFMSFVEDELSDPSSELSRVYSELEAEDTLSDYREKSIRSLANKGEALSPEEAYVLSYLAGRDDDGYHPFEDIGYGDDMGATAEQLEKYAEHIRNYLYTYKDEAQGIDPTIDPNEKHVGPMAQDIEKAAPDCVKETPEGVKTVDGSRLALVNAGVIGELARRLIDLEDKVNGRGTARDT